MTTAWLFPGQGAQYAGMSRFARADRGHDDLFARADELAGDSVTRFTLAGPRERLREPLIAELSITVVALAHARHLRELGQPRATAGYSAGETAALCAAGVLDEHEALRAAAIRGRVLADFVDDGARMITVSGLGEETLRALLAEISEARLSLAGCNAPRHFTVVGPRLEVSVLARRARTLGAQVDDTDAAGPWHSARLLPAARRIFEELKALAFRAPKRALFMGASGRREHDPERIRALYALQVSRTVRWRDLMLRMRKQERIERWMDAGPGRMTYAYLLRTFDGVLGLTLCSFERQRPPSSPEPSLQRVQTQPTRGLDAT